MWIRECVTPFLGSGEKVIPEPWPHLAPAPEGRCWSRFRWLTNPPCLLDDILFTDSASRRVARTLLCVEHCVYI